MIYLLYCLIVTSEGDIFDCLMAMSLSPLWCCMCLHEQHQYLLTFRGQIWINTVWNKPTSCSVKNEQWPWHISTLWKHFLNCMHQNLRNGRISGIDPTQAKFDVKNHAFFLFVWHFILTVYPEVCHNFIDLCSSSIFSFMHVTASKTEL